MALKKKKVSDIPVPFQDRVIISKVIPEERSAGGIIIPEIAIKEQNKGIVIAVGPLVGKTSFSSNLGDQNTDVPVVGDTVLFGEYAGFTVPDTNYLIVKEADVLCKI